MLSAILHLVMALLLLVGAVATFFLWEKEKFGKKPMAYFFFFYLSFAAYSLSIAVPVLFWPENLVLTAWGYNLAIVFLFLVFTIMLKMMMDLYGMSLERTKFFLGLVVFAGVMAVTLQCLDLRLPVFLPGGLILWNVNPVAGWISGVAAAISGSAFAYELAKFTPNNLDLSERLKKYFLGWGGIFLGLGGLAYFPATHQWQIVAAFALVILGISLFTLAFFIPKNKEVENAPRQ